MSLKTKNNTFFCHRVKMVSQENVAHKVLQELLEQEVDQVLLAQKVPRYPQNFFLFCYSAAICVNFAFLNYFFVTP